MLFGMGETLTKEKDALLAPIIRPCYASLALANDYFSFDREWAESLSSPDAPKPLNAVWLYMQWQSVDMATAKWLVREATNQFEVEFLEGCRKFRESSGKSNDRLERYLRGLQYQVSGNVVWSLNCPRYHPDWRYEANEGLEDGLTVEWRGSPLLHVAAAAEQVEDVSVSDLMEATAKRLSITSWGSRESESDVSTTSSLWEDRAASSRSSSVSAMPSDDERHDGMEEFKNAEREKESLDSLVPREEKLGMEIVNAPFEYTRSLPSKNVRATFIDALNLWAGLPEEVLVQIKEVVDDLQTASLM